MLQRHKVLAAGAARLRSHAGAWEREAILLILEILLILYH